MLTRSLHEVAIGNLFASAKVSETLRSYLAAYTDDDDKALADCVQACSTILQQDLDKDHARRFRLGDIAQVTAALWGSDLFASPNLPIMDELFTRLMARNGDFLQYQTAQVQAYARLAAEIDPTMLAAWHLASWLRQTAPLPEDAARVAHHQQPFFAPPPSAHKPYAEGHVHMGGIPFDLLILGERIFFAERFNDNSKKEKAKQNKDLAEKTQNDFHRLRHLIAILLNPDLVDPDAKSLSLRDALRRACATPIDRIDPFDNLQPDWESVRASCVLRNGVVNADWLRWQLAQAVIEGELARAVLWLSIYAWFLYQQPESTPTLRIAIFNIFGAMNQIRRILIMDGQGLSRFVKDYSNATLRKERSPRGGTDIVRELMANEADLAEIKITPENFNPGIVAWVAQAASSRQQVATPFFNWYQPEPALLPKDITHLQKLEQWHFCAHFVRRDETSKSRAALWEKSERLQEALCSESGWNQDVFLGGHSNPAFHFQPANWLRGLDIAGDENQIRNDVFAPVLRWLRRGFLPRHASASATPNFHFSIHVGEDYAHPLSGMRHIDETVRFCEMRCGDRLGHALAIGMEPALWVARQGDMVLPVDEHLDNLVWAWHYASELSARLPQASHIIPLLERRIARFGDFIPWLSQQYQLQIYSSFEDDKPTPSERSGTRFAITPTTLHEAWRLRRNCHYKFQSNQSTPFYNEQLEISVPDFAKLKRAEDAAVLGTSTQGGESSSAERIYLAREQLRLDNKKNLRNVLVRVADTKDWARREHVASEHPAFLYDYESPEELTFMHALQDYLLDQYDRQGLIIETNPSSNVYIARMENHAEHPIFRWHPPHEKEIEAGGIHNKFSLRRGPIRVLVNTDDPGIMPTTLRTEFALLQEAAIDLGYSRTVTEIWLERLRQFGMEEFNNKHQPVFERVA